MLRLVLQLGWRWFWHEVAVNGPSVATNNTLSLTPLPEFMSGGQVHQPRMHSTQHRTRRAGKHWARLSADASLWFALAPWVGGAPQAGNSAPCQPVQPLHFPDPFVKTKTDITSNIGLKGTTWAIKSSELEQLPMIRCPALGIWKPPRPNHQSCSEDVSYESTNSGDPGDSPPGWGMVKEPFPFCKTFYLFYMVCYSLKGQMTHLNAKKPRMLLMFIQFTMALDMQIAGEESL